MRRLAPLGLLVVLAGCQPSPEKQLEGNWKFTNVKLSAAAEKAPMSATIKSSMLAATIDVKPDKTFSMTQMGQPITGTWTIDTRTVTLTTKTISGKTVDELKEQLKKMGMEKAVDALSKPMVLKLSDDGTKLTGDANGTQIELGKAEAK